MSIPMILTLILSCKSSPLYGSDFLLNANESQICPCNSSELHNLVLECPLFIRMPTIAPKEPTPGIPKTKLILFSLRIASLASLRNMVTIEQGKYEGQKNKASGPIYLRLCSFKWLTKLFQDIPLPQSCSYYCHLQTPLPHPKSYALFLESTTLFVLWPLPVPLPLAGPLGHHCYISCYLFFTSHGKWNLLQEAFPDVQTE